MPLEDRRLQADLTLLDRAVIVFCVLLAWPQNGVGPDAGRGRQAIIAQVKCLQCGVAFALDEDALDAIIGHAKTFKLLETFDAQRGKLATLVVVLSCRTALQPDDEDGLQGSVGAKISFGELFIPAKVERFDTRGELDRSQIRQTVVRQADGLDRSEGREIERSDLILLKSEALERRKGGEGRGSYLRAFDSQRAELRAFADLSLSDPLGMTDVKEAKLR